MNRKVLIPLHRDDVAPRFDLAVEVLLAELDEEGRVAGRQGVFLAHASGDELCDFILKNGVEVLIVNGIEEDYYHYLRWKRVEVVDGVMGPADEALARYAAGRLAAGDTLYER